jgi:hypothetical protein
VDVFVVGTALLAQRKEVADETDKINFKSLNKWLESSENKTKKKYCFLEHPWVDRRIERRI